MNYLAENIHKIDWDHLPGQEQCDPHGELLLYSRKCGWMIVHYTDIKDMAKDYKCSYWTYLPEAPFAS